MVEPAGVRASLEVRSDRPRVLLRRLDSLLTRDRVRYYPIIIIGVWTLVYVGTWLATSGNILLPDYTSRWTGGRMLLNGQGDSLYDPFAQWAVQQPELGVKRLTWFVSPPYVAALFAPLAALPYVISCAAWTTISAAALWFSVRLLRPYAPPVLVRNGATTILALAASYAVFYLVAGGQDTALVLLAVAASIRLLDAGRDAAAGAALTLGLVKPHLIVLLPLVFIVHRKPRALATFAAGGAALLAVSVALVGSDGIQAWLQALSSPLYAEEVLKGQAWLSTGIPAFLSALLPTSVAPSWQVVVTAVGVCFWIASLWVIRRRIGSLEQSWALLILTITIASPHFMVYDLVLTFAVLPFVARTTWSATTRLVLVVVYVTLWLTPLLHVVAMRLDWPATIVQAPWTAIGLTLLWLALVRGEADTPAPKRILGSPS